jgi:hypothetical protein
VVAVLALPRQTSHSLKSAKPNLHKANIGSHSVNEPENLVVAVLAVSPQTSFSLITNQTSAPNPASVSTKYQ